MRWKDGKRKKTQIHKEKKQTKTKKKEEDRIIKQKSHIFKESHEARGWGRQCRHDSVQHQPETRIRLLGERDGRERDGIENWIWVSVYSAQEAQIKIWQWRQRQSTEKAHIGNPKCILSLLYRAEGLSWHRPASGSTRPSRVSSAPTGDREE